MADMRQVREERIMKIEEIADRLEELLIVAHNTSYMWYYDDNDVHKGLIALLFIMRNKDIYCPYCNHIIKEATDSCPKCHRWMIYKDLLEKEQ